jgi:predicted Fe-S protein YdhL (DUF1289 family)
MEPHKHFMIGVPCTDSFGVLDVMDICEGCGLTAEEIKVQVIETNCGNQLS